MTPIDLIAVCSAAFLGGLLSQAFVRCVLAPLSNRATHKRLMDKAEFRDQWGRNPVSFFLLHDGFRRGN